MGIFINGLFIAVEQRFREGKADGWNVLLTVGTDAYKIKVPDDVAAVSGLAALSLGDSVTARVRASAFRDTIYFTAESLEVVDGEN